MDWMVQGQVAESFVTKVFHERFGPNNKHYHHMTCQQALNAMLFHRSWSLKFCTSSFRLFMFFTGLRLSRFSFIFFCCGIFKTSSFLYWMPIVFLLMMVIIFLSSFTVVTHFQFVILSIHATFNILHINHICVPFALISTLSIDFHRVRQAQCSILQIIFWYSGIKMYLHNVFHNAAYGHPYSFVLLFCFKFQKCIFFFVSL